MVGIVPKKDAPGVDFCGVDKYYYIVRSDLDCYMRSTNFNRGEDLEIFSLHPACRNGDHYLAHEDDYFYIIKDCSYRRVTNMNSDEGAVVYTLHASCRGGDHYLSAFNYFYIIYQERGVYRRTKNMNTYEDGVEYQLHPNCRNGLYYFGVMKYYYLVKPHDQWGIQYLRCTNFNTNEDAETFSFHPTVINFLPGGLAHTVGPSFGVWECIKTVINESQTPVTWTKKVARKVGCEKVTISTIEKDWKVSASVSVESGGIGSLIAKAQVAFSTEFGGSSVNTDQETWSEATDVEESISMTLNPGQKIFIWQYQIKMGTKPLLFCKDIRFDDDPNPPSDVPLPPAK